MSLHEYWAKKEARLSQGRYILVLNEKHRTSYYDLSDWGGIVKLLAHLFRERDKNNGWYPRSPPTSPGPAPVVPADITDTQLANFWAERCAMHKRYQKKHVEDLQEWEAFDKARAGDDLQAAYLMELRRGFEYEGYEIEDLQIPKG